MPRYRYACKECNLKDIRKFEYEYEHQTERNMPVCPHCGMWLTRSFLNPPREWMRQQVR